MVNFMDINTTAEYLIKSFEGLRLQPYYCPAGLKTIGWGHVIKDDRPQQEVESITEEQAECLLSRIWHKLNLPFIAIAAYH